MSKKNLCELHYFLSLTWQNTVINLSAAIKYSESWCSFSNIMETKIKTSAVKAALSPPCVLLGFCNKDYGYKWHFWSFNPSWHCGKYLSCSVHQNLWVLDERAVQILSVNGHLSHFYFGDLLLISSNVEFEEEGRKNFHSDAFV